MAEPNRATDADSTHAARVVVASIRMSDLEHGALAAAAVRAGMPAARLARLLIDFGIAELNCGNQDLERAIKTSRDA